MSYVERALYDYVKKILTEGIEVLLSKRFIIFSILLVASGGLTIGLIVLQGQGANVDLNIIKLAFIIQISIALSFVIIGLVAKRLLSTFLRIITTIIIFVIIGGIGLVALSNSSLSGITDLYLEFIPLGCFLIWTLLMPIAGFGFARGLFYNKVIGSVLFLGKPKNDNNAIFAFIFGLLSLVGLGAGVYMLFRPELLVKSAGIFTIITSAFVFLSCFGKIFRNDTMNSTFALFYTSAGLPTIFMLAISSSSPIITTLSYVLLIFSLIYTAQGQAKRAHGQALKTEDEIRIEQAKEQFKEFQADPYGVVKIIRYFGPEGILFILLGTFLGYMALQVMVAFDVDQKNANPSNTLLNPLFTNLFGNLTAGQIYQVITIFFIFLIILFVIVTYILTGSTRKYFKDELYRFNWLPSYDEAKAYMTKISTGEIGAKDVSFDAIKLVGSAAVAQARKGASGFLRRFRKSPPN